MNTSSMLWFLLIQLESRKQTKEVSGEIYDLICLSSRIQEWIAQKQGTCYPEDPTWIDVHDCLEVEEETYGQKTKGKGKGNEVIVKFYSVSCLFLTFDNSIQ